MGDLRHHQIIGGDHAGGVPPLKSGQLHHFEHKVSVDIVEHTDGGLMAVAEATKHFAMGGKLARTSGKGAQKEIVMPKRESDAGGFIGWEFFTIGEFQEIAQRKRVRRPDLLLDVPDILESHDSSAVLTLKIRNEGRYQP